MKSVDLTPARYSASKKGWWKPPPAAAPVSAESFSVITYNVCFDDSFWLERCHALLNIVQDLEPEVIAFQEVTPRFLRQILDLPWIQSTYWVSDMRGDSINPYGVLLLSKWPALRLTLHDLPTFMSRKLLVADFSVNDSTLSVGTTHLDSTSRFKIQRLSQLRRCVQLLAAADHALLAGDMNFSDAGEEQNEIPPEYTDVWPCRRPGCAGGTYISRRSGEATARYDRIFLRSSAPGWVPDEIERIGSEEFPVGRRSIRPSDHFGLAAGFSWVK